MGKSNAKSFLAGLLAPADAASDENSDSNGREARSHEAPLLQASPTSSTRPVITDEDAETVLLFLDGSEQAFLRLYAKYETPLLLYLRRMVDGEAMAEDLFQETWIRIFELRKRRTEVGCFKALLFRTAKNLCLNAIRSEQHRSGSSEMLEMLPASDETNKSSEQLEMQALLTHALKQLPVEQREAFILHEYSGYSYAEIAVLMETNEVNVKVRAHRARLRLKKFIASWLGLREDDDPTNAI